jgi:ribonuclease D
MLMDKTSYAEAARDERNRGAPSLSNPSLVASPEALTAMLQALAAEPIIALDTESDSLYRYFHKVCLIQVSTTQTDYLVDPLVLPQLGTLGTLLANPDIEKVFHAAENDILALKRDFGVGFMNVFDTMLAARILGYPRVSLAALLREKFGVEIDKRAQLTDWGHRPLSAEQLNYARLDTHYLLPLRDLLQRELVSRQRWREAQEAFCSLPAISCGVRAFDPEGFWRNKDARDLSSTQLAILRELYIWRDGQARSMDRPPFKVLSDEALARLSREQPRRASDLAVSQWQLRRFGGAILAAIARGQAAPAPQPPSRQYGREQRLDPITVTRYDKLRAWRSRRAAERGVEADIVLTNEVLMVIARSAPDNLEALSALEVMGPWKLEEYGDDVLGVLATVP